MPTHIRPFGCEDAVHHRVAWCAVFAHTEVPDDAVLLCAARRDLPLRSQVDASGAQTDHLAPKRFERVPQQQALARRVDVCPLMALRVPRVPNLYAVDSRHDVVVPGRTDDDPGSQIAYDPRQHVTIALTLQRGPDIGRHPTG